MKLADNVKNLIKHGHVSVHPDADERMLNGAMQRLKLLRQTKSRPVEISWWKMISFHRIIIAAVCCMIVVVATGIARQRNSKASSFVKNNVSNRAADPALMLTAAALQSAYEKGGWTGFDKHCDAVLSKSHPATSERSEMYAAKFNYQMKKGNDYENVSDYE